MSSASSEASLVEASLEEVVAFWRELLSLSDLSSDDRAAASLNLANALSDIADQHGDSTLCDEAVERGDAALAMAPASSEAKTTILSDLSTIYLTRFELKGDTSDLVTSARLIRSAVDETPLGHESYPARLANLVNTLCTRFVVFGRTNDLEDAIVASEKSAEASHTDLDSRARALSNKGRALALRYERYQIVTDIEEAIRVTEDAMTVADDASVIAICAINLVGHLVALAERDCSDKTLDRAINTAQEQLKSLEGTSKAMLAHNLSYLYRLKFERVDHDGDPSDLQSAVDYAIEAINLPSDISNRAIFYDNLALCMENAHQKSPTQGYLDSAIGFAENAKALLSADHPTTASILNHLASLLKTRGTTDDLEASISISKSVLSRENASLLVRISAGQQCGLVLADLARWDEASVAFQSAVDLIPYLARNSLRRRDQQYVLAQLTGLSQSAASAALEAGSSPLQAFSVLEKGRSVLVELAITAKSNVTSRLEGFAETKPLLKRREELAALVASDGMAAKKLNEKTPSVSALTSMAIQAVQELILVDNELKKSATDHGLAANIGSQDNFVEALGEDIAVAFNTTKYRCDAFIIDKSGVKSIPLPSLKLEDLAKYVRSLVGPNRITKFKLSTYSHSNVLLQDILKWLWNVAVRPVLSELGLGSSNNERTKLPRICWITSGAMGIMPFHAAGDHLGTPGSCAMDFVVSSYAVSFRSLAWCRRTVLAQAKDWTHESVNAAAIMMPSTLGHKPLRTVESEFMALKNAVPHVEKLLHPSSAQVEQLLPSLEVAHFACHAKPSIEDPSAGSLLLYNKAEKQLDRLSIYKISEIDTSSAWLAYLSACQTADIQDLDYMDEMIHIAAAFQVSGFPQVVGTLWQVEDEITASLTATFYVNQGLVGTFRGLEALHRDTAVLALHDSLQKIRVQNPGQVLSWAQFIVFGA